MIDTNIQSELRARYNPDGSQLRQYQLRMLEMLRFIDKVCQENNIPYWLSSGTCLGAVRHGGFIPWDDDVDIEMTGKDYKRFVKTIGSMENIPYVVQTHKTDPAYIQQFGKLRDLNSEIPPTDYGEMDYRFRGMFVDLFKMEPSPSRIIALFGKYLYLACWAANKIKNRTLRYIIRSFNYIFLFEIIGSTVNSILKLIPTKRLRHVFGSVFTKPRHVDDIFPLTRMDFEGYEFNVPGNVDRYLTSIFGKDYMQLPDDVLRQGHHLNRPIN